MKKLLIAIVAFGFASTASADNLEIQISSNTLVGGSDGQVEIYDEDLGDRTAFGLQGEVYYTVAENIQVGGMLGFSDTGADGSNLMYNVGVAGRYNLDTDFRNSVWFGLGVAYTDNGSDGDTATSIAAFVQAGKRFALSDNITYTPNVTYGALVGGDIDEGSVITLNLISFSGFMNL